jgi:hypothetical protein
VNPGLLPADRDGVRVLLDVSLFERTLYELGYETGLTGCISR